MEYSWENFVSMKCWNMKYSTPMARHIGIYALRPGQARHASSTAEVKLCSQVYVCPRVPRLQCSLHHRGVQGLRQRDPLLDGWPPFQNHSGPGLSDILFWYIIPLCFRLWFLHKWSICTHTFITITSVFCTTNCSGGNIFRKYVWWRFLGSSTLSVFGRQDAGGNIAIKHQPLLPFHHFFCRIFFNQSVNMFNLAHVSLYWNFGSWKIWHF